MDIETPADAARVLSNRIAEFLYNAAFAVSNLRSVPVQPGGPGSPAAASSTHAIPETTVAPNAAVLAALAENICELLVVMDHAETHDVRPTGSDLPCARAELSALHQLLERGDFEIAPTPDLRAHVMRILAAFGIPPGQLDAFVAGATPRAPA